MWTTKHFKTQDAMDKWIEKNSNKYQITILYVNNGYALEYKKLRML
jgi:hypothetical protein